MKTELKNSSRHLRTGFKITLGVAIIIALLLFARNRARGESHRGYDAQVAILIKSSKAIDGHSVRASASTNP